MVLGAGTAIEHRDQNTEAVDGILVNIGLSSRCPLKKRCGERCFLIQALPKTPDMPPAERDVAIEELLDAGPDVRHMVACEWEPLAEPEALRRALRSYHARPADQRPQAFGIITSALLTHRVPWLPQTPLTWALVSLDGEAETHHRGLDLFSPAWTGLMKLKETGGARFVGVNSVLAGGEASTSSILRLTRRLIDAGIQYHGVGPYMDIQGERMVSQVSADELLRIYERFTTELSGEATPEDFTMMMELPPEVFERISGDDPFAVRRRPWRLEHRVAGSPVVAATINPTPGRFFRLRADGQVIDHSDLMTVGLLEGRYGRYQPGRLKALIRAAQQAHAAGRDWQPEPMRIGEAELRSESDSHI